MHKPPKILIVDDTQSDAVILSRLLQHNGYQILSAEDGMTAFNIAADQIPDLILLDVVMPGMDGYEVCRALKNNEITSDIPVVFVTAKADTEDKVRGLDAGGVDYIAKPFMPAEVKARVRTHLKLKAMHEENLEYHRELLRSQKMASITTLAGGIAHNINNLMGAIIGYADMLQSIPNLDEKASRYISKILEASQSVADLTSDLLIYARAGYNATMSSVNVREMLEKMIGLYKAPKSPHVDVYVPDHIPPIKVDQEQMLQALSNVFMNAQEASPDGSTITITVSTGKLPSDHHSEDQDSETYVIISISDAGPGMDEETAQKVFEPFFTTKQTVGAGLGLSAAYGIVQKHDGVIIIDTERNAGSTFHVYLPIMQESLSVMSEPDQILLKSDL